MAYVISGITLAAGAYGLYQLYGWMTTGTKPRDRLRELATEYLRTTPDGTSCRMSSNDKRELNKVMEIYRKRKRVIDVDEKFERQQFLGKGGFGEVYRWDIRENGLSVAGKEVPLTYFSCTKMLLDEAGQLSKLRHQNIIRFLGTFIDSRKKKAYLFMELMDTSVGILARQNPIPEYIACSYTLDILHGLLYLYDKQLHGKEIIHCDIKGDNILVNKGEGIAKLADFGLSMKVYYQQDYRRVSDELRGTIHYVSPEILKGEPNGKSSDIWALGCTIYEMLEQYPPFRDSKLRPPIQTCIRNMDHRNLVKEMRATDGAKRFLRSIFVKRESRPYPSDLLKDSWFDTEWGKR